MTVLAHRDTGALVSPGSSPGLLDVLRRRYLLRLLVRKELRVRYRGSVLGLAWSYVKPAVQFAVFYVALGIFLDLNRSIENFAVYMFSGIVVITFFSEAFSNATRSVVVNAPLVKKIYLPRELFPVAATWVAGVHLLPQMVVLVVVCLLTGWSPRPVHLLAAALGLVVIVALAVGAGLACSALNVYFRDAENLVDLFVMVATWTSPVLYSWTMVRDSAPEWFFTLYQLNPITVAVELFHFAFWHPTTTGAAELPPHLLRNGVIGLVTVLLVTAIGQYVFKRLEGRFAQEL